jgi:RimJ/RimL family protein N-acetyltransferase
MAIPEIDTPRLTLRGHRIDDFAETAAMWADPAVTRFIGGRPFTAEEAWGRLHRYVGHWALLGFGFWAVCEKASGRLVGEVGFADFKREIDPPFGGKPEAGWVLAPWGHGKGYATEAMLAALAWADRRFTATTIVCIIDPANAPSIRVAEKCGFQEWTRTTYKGDPTIVFERPEAR